MSAMLDLDGIRVLVTRRSNAVRMKLSWQENRQWFTLSVPPGVRREDIMAFLRQSRPWMQEHQQKTDAHWQPLYAAGQRALLNGVMVTLGRNGIPCGREFLQHRSKVLQQRVQHLLPLWQQKMGLAVRRVTLKDMSSRWGSCTARLGHISLSQRLGAMPDSLIELVLVHELCHMFHQDHSPAFHAEMARWLPDHRTREQQLKAMSRQLHYPPEEEVP